MWYRWSYNKIFYVLVDADPARRTRPVTLEQTQHTLNVWNLWMFEIGTSQFVEQHTLKMAGEWEHVNCSSFASLKVSGWIKIIPFSLVFVITNKIQKPGIYIYHTYHIGYYHPCIVSIVWKNHEDRTTLSIKFPTPRQDTLSAPTDDIVAPPPYI